MKEYESVFVLNPSVDDSQVDAELEKIKEFLTGRNSEITEVQKWGRRKLAYEIGKNKEGIYTLIRFNADSSVPRELNRRYRLNENMLRYLTVLYEKPPVETTPTDAAEKPPAERAPAVRAPAEKAPAEKEPAEKAPTEKESAEKAPTEKESAEKAPEE
jgi:small subunit ribosomal protein S6